jgi:ribosomal protein S18 acetylase RimI-like enzyme
MSSDFILDAPTSDELKFVLDSWSSSFRASKYAGCVPNNIWEETHRRSMTQLMTRSNCRTVVALTPTSDGSRGRIAGYSVSEPGVLHWLYVKKDYRRLGVGRLLLDTLVKYQFNEVEKAFPRFTHMTDAARRFLPPGWKWDPIPARVKVE